MILHDFYLDIFIVIVIIKDSKKLYNKLMSKTNKYNFNIKNILLLNNKIRIINTLVYFFQDKKSIISYKFNTNSIVNISYNKALEANNLPINF